MPLAEEPTLRVVPLGDARSQHPHERRDVPGAGLAVRLREVGQLVEEPAGLVEVAEDAGLLLVAPVFWILSAVSLASPSKAPPRGLRTANRLYPPPTPPNPVAREGPRFLAVSGAQGTYTGIRSARRPRDRKGTRPGALPIPLLRLGPLHGRARA